MASEKRYFWLKLDKSFFKQKVIKKLRKMAGGDTYTIIYLKMLLTALNRDGYYYYEGIEDTFCEEVASEIEEDVEDVRMTIAYLQSKGIIEMKSEEEFQILTCAEMVGSECGSARRVRALRQKSLQCNINVTECNTEKEIDIEKELEIEERVEKKKKKASAEVYFPNDPLLNQTFLDYLDMRKKKRIPNTDRAIDLAIKEIEKIAGNDNDMAIKVIEQSILKGWTGIFPLKGNKQESSVFDEWRNA